VIAGLGSITFALADTLWVAVIGRTLVGLGVSFPFIALLKIRFEIRSACCDERKEYE